MAVLTERYFEVSRHNRISTAGKHERYDAGFTVIELLTVIAIISVLLAILFPAANRSRALARRTVCMSRLKNISIAMRSYGSSHQDLIIPAKTLWHMPDPQELWHFVLLDYLGSEYKSRIFENHARILFCPEDRDPYPQGFMNYPHGVSFSSYAQSGFYQSANPDRDMPEIRTGPGGNYKFQQISSASQCMLFGETTYSGQIYDAFQPGAVEKGLAGQGHHRRSSGFYHSGMMNIVYVDGRVDSFRGIDCKSQDEFIPPGYETGKYMFYRRLRLYDFAENPAFWGPRCK